MKIEGLKYVDFFNDNTTKKLTFPKGALYNWFCSIYIHLKIVYIFIYIVYNIYLSHWPLKGNVRHCTLSAADISEPPLKRTRGRGSPGVAIAVGRTFFFDVFFPLHYIDIGSLGNWEKINVCHCVCVSNKRVQ